MLFKRWLNVNNQSGGGMVGGLGKFTNTFGALILGIWPVGFTSVGWL
jgi:hypothetical protein